MTVTSIDVIDSLNAACLIHARMPDWGRAFVHGHTFLHSWSGLMTLVVGLLHGATFLSIVQSYSCSLCVFYWTLVVAKDSEYNNNNYLIEFHLGVINRNLTELLSSNVLRNWFSCCCEISSPVPVVLFLTDFPLQIIWEKRHRFLEGQRQFSAEVAV